MQTIAFLVGAVVAVYGGVQTVRARNPIHAALWLVLNFVALAYLYLLLQAPFLAAVQVAVYAGAIMVLFLFIIMYMNLRELPDAGGALAGRTWGVLAACLLGAGIFVRFIGSPAFREIYAHTGPVPDASVAAVGATLLRDFALPFEIASVLLLVAMIGVLVVVRQTAAGGGRQATVFPSDEREGDDSGAATPLPDAERDLVHRGSGGGSDPA